ncbi:formimidoylglutamate deiminase [Nocardioides sp. CFH 31398]|uniref:formimidoylglutamate deiminase n=1 Tax=Nocardioides sp. CFH 31398 TaxID=2919579 RepID=UPI001F068096|nr:formimidoylglutamate deiminase [Nocardioides sp. CFH 31398]MCH1865010.1 formimidoylglutamate deiminase [Nocardioides sp. CFH 31398]
MTAHLLQRAVLPDGVHDDVLVVVEDGRFAEVTPGAARPRGALEVPGLTIPGLANAHSHAFHRALRGRTHAVDPRGSFWTWREQMYDVAARLTPASYLRLARATYREMAAAGITAVGEFHYLHHTEDGTAHEDPNAMGLALVEAARQAGIRLTLLDTCYLAGGFGEPVSGVQVRYDDGSAAAWSRRVSALDESLADRDDVVVGAAVHSVRAVPAEEMATVAGWASELGRPLHLHLSEQPAENEACLAATGLTPTGLAAREGLLGDRTSVVHATHLTDDDVAALGAARAYACFCPTTERDLADGVGPSAPLRDAGARLTLGSDSHAVVDLLEEARAVELDERLVSGRRGHWSAADLLAAATVDGHASLGFGDAGRIEVGARADLVTLDDASVRTAGTGSQGGADLGTAVFAAAAEDVVRTVVDGRVVFRRADRPALGRELAAAIAHVSAATTEGAHP